MGHIHVPGGLAPGAVAMFLTMLAAACAGRPAAAPGATSSAVPVGGTVPAGGTVTGVAAVCTGPAPAAGDPWLRVLAQRGQRTVAREWVNAGPRDTGGRYRLTLTPGDYVISAPMSGAPPAAVDVRAGGTITVNFPQQCMSADPAAAAP